MGRGSNWEGGSVRDGWDEGVIGRKEMVKGSKGQRGWKYLNSLLSDFFTSRKKFWILNFRLKSRLKV